MSDKNPDVEQVIASLKGGQESLHSLMDEQMEENADMPTELRIFYALNVALENPKITDWKRMMDNMEALVKDPPNDEVLTFVYQEVLETFANSITNKVFEHTWITPYIGPLCREYIEEYDQFMRSKTPGF